MKRKVGRPSKKDLSERASSASINSTTPNASSASANATSLYTTRVLSPNSNLSAVHSATNSYNLNSLVTPNVYNASNSDASSSASSTTITSASVLTLTRRNRNFSHGSRKHAITWLCSSYKMDQRNMERLRFHLIGAVVRSLRHYIKTLGRFA